MHTSVSKIFAFGLLVSVPLAAAYAIPSQSEELTRKDEGGLMGFARSVLPLEAREPHHTEAQIAAKEAKKNPASNSTITITGTGAASLPAKPDGCATITPTGQGAQTVCAKAITATGFTMSVKDVATGKKISCTVKGTAGTCGTNGVGASVSALAKRKAKEEVDN